jgi:CRISPR-associated endonuclease Csn1
MRVLGLDGGIASTGWAVLGFDSEDNGQILAAGTRTFESPEESTKSGPKLKNADRRMYRLQRRVVRRRSQRMALIRKLFHERGMIESLSRKALDGHGLDPWELRAQGLERVLNPREWAIALGHIAVHRGFRSSRKNPAKANQSDNEDGKMLKAIEATRDKLTKYRTVGEMFARDEAFIARKRNADGLFTRSILRGDQEAEIRTLFAVQKRFGNTAVSAEFQTAYEEAAFSQRPMQSAERMVGPCTFEPQEKRTSRFSPSFEAFRFLSRMAAMKLETGVTERSLTPDEIRICFEGFGQTAKVSAASIRKKLDLDTNTRFSGIARDEEGKIDIAARTGEAAKGTAAFLKVLKKLGDIETRNLFERHMPAIDRAAELITFNDDEGLIKEELRKTTLPEEAITVLVEGLDAFKAFRGTANLSAKAVRAILPHLTEGMVYSEACEAAGYDHAARPVTKIEDISSPTARKALSEMLKQVKVLWQAYGPFDEIHLEMARDVGKGIEERSKIERGINKRTTEKQKAAEELKEKLSLSGEISPEDLLRYELWKEQNGKCLYTDESIPLPHVMASSNLVQVDHILPWSRFNDDSFINKTLCFTKANADKRGRTPFEWFSETKPLREWELFEAGVESCKSMKGIKKRNYLLRNAREREEGLRNRNLNDTRYACRVLLAELKREYFPDEKHKVQAFPGAITAKMRQAWGLEVLKKIDGKRVEDDRHHALDAMVIAAMTRSILMKATKAAQEAERQGRDFTLRNMPEPWTGFRDEVKAMFSNVFVSRAEVRRARGKAHDATIKQLREVEGQTRVFERKLIGGLNEKDLDLIPVPEPHGKVVDPQKLRDEMVENLRAWILAGKPPQEDKLPRSPKGDVIRKVRVESKSKPAIEVRGGTAKRGDMVRVDVFSKNGKGNKREFYVVPIYIHDVIERKFPPDRAVHPKKPRDVWPIIDSSFKFLFSVSKNSLIEFHKDNGEIIRGYYRELDTDGDRISISGISNNKPPFIRVIMGTLIEFKKFIVDRLGNVSEVTSEIRTWHGKACTLPSPDGSS